MTVMIIRSILRRTAPGAPRTQQQLLQASHDDKPQSHWATGSLSVDFKVISCEVSLKYTTQNSKQKQYHCTFLVPIDCLYMAGLQCTPSEKAFFSPKILKLYWTAWRAQACYTLQQCSTDSTTRAYCHEAETNQPNTTRLDPPA